MEGLAISSPSRGSPTPKAVNVIDLCSPSPSPRSERADSPLAWDYGGAADLDFDPVGAEWYDRSPPPAPDDDLESLGGESVVSVSRSDAGLELSDSEWGEDAVMVWDGQSYSDAEEEGGGAEATICVEDDDDDDGEDDDHEAEDDDYELGEDEYEVHDISVSDDEEHDISASSMPDYANWDIPKLQVRPSLVSN